MPGVDARVAVQALKQRALVWPQVDHVGVGRGEFGLRVPVSRERGSYGEDLSHAAPGFLRGTAVIPVVLSCWYNVSRPAEVFPLRRRHVSASVPAANSSTSTAAIPIAAMNGTLPRPLALTTASATAATSPIIPTHRRAGRAATNSTADAASSSVMAAARTAPLPQRAATCCGSPRTPAISSPARSGRALAKCPPRPTSAAATVTHQCGSGWPGSVEVAYAGIEPKPTRYISPDASVDFRPAL